MVIEINASCKDFSHQLSFWDSEAMRFNNEEMRFNTEIIRCCYVCYMLTYSLKSAVKHRNICSL